MKTITRVALGLFLIAGLLPSRLAAQGSSCAGQPNGTSCDDGNTCTAGDQCASGMCIAPVRFAQPAGSPIAVEELPWANVAVDVNHDGKPDLIVLNYTSNTFTVLLGNGAGGFSQPAGSPVPTPSAAQILTVADFNVDGNVDVAIASATSTGSLISVHLGNGVGGFTLAPSPFSSTDWMGPLAAGDLNRDGKPDLIASTDSMVWVLLGNGAGGFTMAPGSPVDVGGLGTREGVVGDFNRDGNLDVAVASQASGSVSLLLGDGTGGVHLTPQSPIVLDTASGLATGDLNLDGMPDLVSAGQTQVAVLLGTGTGGFVASTVLTAEGYFQAAAVGDFSRDGKPDIAVLNYWTDEFSVLIGNGTGGFAELTDPSFGGLNTPISAPVADFNLDGKPDLAVSNFEASTISIFLNDVGAPDGSSCSAGNDCTTDTCTAGVCVGGLVSNCDDNDPCTTDACGPAGECFYTYACDDGNGCTVDLCDPTTGQCSYELVNCGPNYDACTFSTCDPAMGCVLNDVDCDDGDACNGAEACDSYTGCFSGTPVVCAAPGPCQTAGVCNPGTGTCSYGSQPNGTACTGGTCQNGVCTPDTGCTSTHNPRTVGFWRKVCRYGTFRGESIGNVDAACVGQLSDTFGGFTSRNQVCNVLDGDHDHHDDFRRGSCSKAEDQLMALALNLCKERVCCDDGIDSRCDNDGHEDDLTFSHNHHGDDDDDDGHHDGDDDDDDDPGGDGSTVCDSFNTADALLDDPERASSECRIAECLSKEINNGHSLEFATLVVRREGNNVRLAWLSPVLNDGTARPDSYKIWRRDARSTAPLVQIGSTMSTEFLDVTGGNGSWEYDVTAVLPDTEDD